MAKTTKVEDPADQELGSTVPTFYLPFSEQENSPVLVIRAMYNFLFFEAEISKNIFKSKIITLGQVYKVLQKEFRDDSTKTNCIFKVDQDSTDIRGIYVVMNLSFQRVKECDPMEEDQVIYFKRYHTEAEKLREMQRNDVERLQQEYSDLLSRSTENMQKVSELESENRSLQKLVDELNALKVILEKKNKMLSSFIKTTINTIAKLDHQALTTLEMNGEACYDLSGQEIILTDHSDNESSEISIDPMKTLSPTQTQINPVLCKSPSH